MKSDKIKFRIEVDNKNEVIALTNPMITDYETFNKILNNIEYIDNITFPNHKYKTQIKVNKETIHAANHFLMIEILDSNTLLPKTIINFTKDATVDGKNFQLVIDNVKI